ncbi:hypothetical protein E1218_33510 [Kribbella turkmenica]|uniref:Uncharacterized protein n=1 Tax=Kribbella turkmenica TaxID=2530375 RepID=A0A4R4WKD3_9ACTN|nr:hypothetical protein [Kribbella turkmenica]TDD14150.1 hypothetical protein E1218_33510 [Kribbella turkmenica]
MGDLEHLLNRVSSPADLAVILVAAPLAYVLDAGLDVIGFLAPGYVAISTASVALGLKKVVEVRLSRRGRVPVLQRAAALREHLAADGGSDHLLTFLDAEIALHRRGATTEEDFESALKSCLTQYRGRSLVERSDAGISGGRR